MKKLSILLAIVVLAAAVGIGVLVNRNNTVNKELASVESAKAKLETKVGELETAKNELETKVGELETAKAELMTNLSMAETEKASAEDIVSDLTTTNTVLEVKVSGLEAAKADLETKLGAAETAKAAAEAKAGELETAKAELETAKADLETKLSAAETAKTAAETKAGELETVKAELEAAAAAQDKYGLGMVTSIGSVADATAEKAGAAQVNTTVCSLVLDAEGKIKSVTWDVQQTKIQFSAEGKPVDLPEQLLTKLEKGEAYGMRKASAIGKEWFEQIAAFAEYAVGKTVEEMLAIPVYERDANHTQVPDVEELKASVTVTVGDYLAALEKAANSAK